MLFKQNSNEERPAGEELEKYYVGNMFVWSSSEGGLREFQAPPSEKGNASDLQTK